jgi:hypothetical protein
MPTLSTSSTYATSYYKVANFGFASTYITQTYPAYFYPFVPRQQPSDVFFADFQNLVQGDFNGDGIKDIAFTWSYFPHFFQRADGILARPLIFFNDGHGNLRTDATKFTPAASGGRTILETSAVADFNRDGIDDIVSSSGGLNSLLANTYVGEPIPLVLSGPDGVFQDATRNIAGQENGTSLPTGFHFAHDVTVGDFDGDRDADIFTGKTLLLNDGTGRFSNATTQLPAALRDTSYWFFSTASGDFDRDGIADIAAFAAAPNMPSYLMLSGGKTTFADRTVVALPAGYFGVGSSTTRDSAVGDIDQDGDLDLVALSSRDIPTFLQGIALQILTNDGTGRFTDATAARINNAPLANLSASGQDTATTGYGGSDVYLMDWNGDGHLDLIVHSGLGPNNSSRPLMSIFQNDGTGRFAPVDLSVLPYVQPWQLAGYENQQAFFSRPFRQTAPADLNGDRMIDFVSVVDTIKASYTAPSSPSETTAYTILSQAVYGTGPAGRDGHTAGAPGFNEAYYLNTHASAATAVAQGQFANGLAHYLAVGKAQGLRAFAPGTKIFGGTGVDTVNFAGNASGYTVQISSAGTTVRDGTASDALNSIERLRFADKGLALDVSGNAGKAAKVIGAVFGKTAVANKEYMGIGLSLLDGGMTYEALAQLALNAKLGAGASHTAVVNLLFANVVGTAPDASALALYKGLLDSGTLSQGQLGVAAADHPLLQTAINLTGLAATGIEYI